MSDSSILLKEIRFSLGSGHNLGRPKNFTESYRKFKKRFQEPQVTPEKYHEYKKLSDQRQRYLKGVNGWFMRAPVQDGKRTRDTIYPGDLITLDVDYATPEWMDDLKAGNILPGYVFFAHTTRSHTPEKPRVRMLIPLATQLPKERYQAACRIVAKLADPDLEHVDKVSARIAQMMYMPTVSKDMAKHYVFYEQGGDVLDWQDEIERWEQVNGPASDIGNLPRFKGEGELREAAEKAEDPLEKKGAIGTFCRAYSITELVIGKDGEPGILSEFYEPTEWNEGVITRMTYIHGSTSNGAVVYEDKFVYSHHGSDPAQEQLVNAYDLVRIHKFNAADDDPEETMSKRASVKKMSDWLPDDPGYATQLVEERYDLDTMLADDDDDSWIDDTYDDLDDDLLGDFSTMAAEATKRERAAEEAELDDLLGVPISEVVDTRPSRYQRQRASKPPKKWVATELELTQDGAIKSTLHNIATIITNDPRFYRKIALNQFSHQTMLLAPITTKSRVVPDVEVPDTEKGALWTALNDITIRAVIEGPNGRGKPGYGIKVPDRDLRDAIKLAGANNAYHPIREMIEEWRDLGPPKEDVLDGFCHRHLGADHTSYVDNAFRMMLIAAIERIERPGCKFDYAMILEGPQGIGKSTFIKLLCGEEFFGEMDADLSNAREVAEHVSGLWFMELPELTALNKADHNAAKAFMRKQIDRVRMAYDAVISNMPRQNVFWGSTNDDTYLKDPTGNRSYWPVKCRTTSIDFSALLRERQAMWRQAVYEHDQLRAQYPTGDLPLTLTGADLVEARKRQEAARQKQMWETWADAIEEFLSEPVLKSEVLFELGAKVDELEEDNDELVTRVFVSVHTIQTKVLGLRDEQKVLSVNMQDDAFKKAIDRVLEETDWERCHNRRLGGRPRRGFFLTTADAAARNAGYALTVEADAHPESDGTDTEDLL